MFSKEDLKLLHKETHERLDLLIDHAATMPAELFTREVDGFGRTSVRDQLCHVFSTESAWICGLQNSPLLRIASEEVPDLSRLVQEKGEVVGRTVRYLDSLSVEALNANILTTPKDWIGPERSPAFILLHVITHAFHHKGQVAAMFRMLGHPIGDTDLQRE